MTGTCLKCGRTDRPISLAGWCALCTAQVEIARQERHHQWIQKLTAKKLASK